MPRITILARFAVAFLIGVLIYIFILHVVTKNGGPHQNSDIRTNQRLSKSDANSAAKREFLSSLKEIRKPDVIFVAAPEDVVLKLLEIAEVKKDDIVYDLGCGDGRIVVTAALKYGCKAVGFDIDPQRVIDSVRNVERNNVQDLVTIEQKDIFTLDLSGASVITMFLFPKLNVKLIPQLEKCKPGTRILSIDFDMQGVTPERIIDVNSENGEIHRIYLWITPLKKEKLE